MVLSQTINSKDHLMNKLIIFALISTTLLGNMEFSQTYFECSDVFPNSSQIRLKDSEKDKELLTYQVIYHNGESEQFDLAKNAIIVGMDN